jgi:hypothetical protein
MLADLGRGADAAITKGADAAREAVHATVLHLRRIAGALSEAVGRVSRETQDLVWDYRDVASDLRRPERDPEGASTPADRPERPVLRVVNSDR